MNSLNDLIKLLDNQLEQCNSRIREINSMQFDIHSIQAVANYQNERAKLRGKCEVLESTLLMLQRLTK